MQETILITGGLGFIGSHACVALAQAGYRFVIVDNLSNSCELVLDRIETIVGSRPVFIRGDIRDSQLLHSVFSSHVISAVIHFAGLKAVGESIQQPLDYYDNNVRGTLEVLAAMRKFDVKTLVFSSSATVYGNPSSVPILENFPRSATNPYGRSKLIVEDMLADLYESDPSWRIARLRYFNPIGAHESGMIGEDPRGTPNNIMPFITQVAVGRLRQLSIFGGDYPTPDGTGIRDYIHVMDLVEGHIAALNYLVSKGGFLTANLGTGVGVSVLELLRAFEAASGNQVPYVISDRRPGDIAACWSDTSHARAELGWQARRSLRDMCEDSWHWQSRNPHGYREDTQNKGPIL